MKRPAKPGRVAAEPMFSPAVRKRRLVYGAELESTKEATLTATAGAWLKSLREERGLTQSDIAAALGIKHYARISQMESGKIHLQPQNFEPFAAAVGIEPREFVRQLLSYYSPEVYEILFGDVADQPASSAPAPDLI